MYTKNQVFTTVVASFLTLIAAALLTWPTTLVDIFLSTNTPLDRPMSATESALFGSIGNIGSMFGLPLFTYLFDTIGRKKTTTATAFPLLTAWIIVSSTNKVYAVILATFISGLTLGGIIVSIVFVSEIASVEIRGTLSSTPIVGFSVGMLISYVIGGVLDYHTVIYTHMTLAVIYTALSLLTKESPTFLLMQNDVKGALVSLSLYRGLPGDSKQVQDEINELKCMIASESVTSQDEEANISESEKLNKEAVVAKKPESAWKIIRHSRPVRKAIFLSASLLMLSNIMGLNAVLVYAYSLFRTAVPNFSPTMCSVLLALSMMCSSICGALVSDKLGRKTLMLLSSVLSAVFMLILATQLHLGWGPSWLSVTAILLYTFVFNIGAGTVPFILGGEILIPEVRGVGTAITINCGCLMSFTLLFLFPFLVKNISLHGVMYIFTIICILTTVYSMKYMPETKGLTSKEIQNFFHKG